jgi:hypothetical protein
MSDPLVSTEQMEAIIRKMPAAFTILDFANEFRRCRLAIWRRLVKRYGLYGSGTRYSALTYLSNRLSAYSRRKAPGLLEPTPTGWKPAESRFLRRTRPDERKKFGSPWIVVFRRQGEGSLPLSEKRFSPKNRF